MTKIFHITMLLTLMPLIWGSIADPTEPPMVILPGKTIKNAELSLKIIKFNPATGVHTANINGVLLTVGEKYFDATLKRVTKNTVELLGPNGEKIVLRLFDVQKY